MDYNISVTLSEEENDALLATVQEINAQGGNTDVETILRENGTNFVAERVRHYYGAAISRLGTAAAALSYSDRKALIAQVESQLP